MRASQILLVPASLIVGALLALVVAILSVDVIESSSEETIQDALTLRGHEWVEVQADGLQVVLSGTAPSEAMRFRALSIAGGEVDAARIIDNMTIPAAEAIQPPRFSIEVLRNDAGVSMIGLIPTESDRDTLINEVAGIAGRAQVTDLLEVADYPIPANWDSTLDFAIYALQQLPRAKISMDADKVAITAVADSAEEQQDWARRLKRKAPRSILLSIDISAPRPVITPFTLRFLIDENGPRFDACSAHDAIGRAKIISAATEAGLDGVANCIIGLGVPSPDWADAAEMGINAVATLGGGSVTFSDADVTLVAQDTTPQATFDRVVGELESNLPDLYSLHSVLPEPVKIDGTGEGEATPEFVATLSPEGQVQLRGRLTDDALRSAAESFARAKFGSGAVYPATRLDPDLPGNWPTRVLAGLEALSLVANGVVVVQPDIVDIRGRTGDPEASGEISRLLGEKLGASENFQVNVTYEESLNPTLNLPSPEQCAADINAVLAEKKITFAPGSANIEASAADTVDKIAEIMRQCSDVRMEIAGFTDSQGREEMNLALSQNRAQAVLSALLSRRILTSNLSAVGYGEESPIADNGTEDGREANRRIEFRLLEGVSSDNTDVDDAGVDAPVEGDTTQAEADAPSDDSATPSTTDPDATAEEPAAEAPAADAPPEDATENASAAEETPETVVAPTGEDAPVASGENAPADSPAEDTPAAEQNADAAETQTDDATAETPADPVTQDTEATDTETPDASPPESSEDPAEPSYSGPEIFAPDANDIRPAPRPDR
ncbi:OmpA-OmpF porin, OOP family [Aliiroseovarius halocynthiae]|uniref:OmpA family protein n=1 Tax=Aliiroseovarius halocynthiae TaxID=985055 RepID=A0A545SXV9_9RHOB|nr:OmpA family protein [Aliiroseovarius halocynthiae]TQV69798.1 OmpA family protein [Aliiroseovarius halocynthiae]SMR81740.1 OmpA-OmpF porin, OOP family [Aliiroseovarius halocynthiae]